MSATALPDAPVATASAPHVTPASAMPDVLPQAKPRGRVLTFIRRYPTIFAGGLLAVMPSAAVSSATVLVRPTTPCLAAT